MPRPKSKSELITAANENFACLMKTANEMTKAELETPFDFSNDTKKAEAHWKRDKNLRDVLIHLYEWHQLLLKWAPANRSGNSVPFLPEPFNWKTYGDMNVGFWNKHQSTDLETAKKMLEKSHADVMALLDTFTDAELFEKDVFPWVGGSVLGSYFISVTSSHYDWAIKKLKAHKKIVYGK